VEVVALLSQGRTAAAQCGLFTHKSVPVIFEPPCRMVFILGYLKTLFQLRSNVECDGMAIVHGSRTIWEAGLTKLYWHTEGTWREHE